MRRLSSGASEVNKLVLRKLAAKGLSVHVIWVPMAGGEVKHVRPATVAVSDPRARHYWDATGALIRDFRKPLGLSQPAWDVYLIYPAKVQWTRSAPKPAFWMHQLPGADRNAPSLDPEQFRRALERTLSKRPPA